MTFKSLSFYSLVVTSWLVSSCMVKPPAKHDPVLGVGVPANWVAGSSSAKIPSSSAWWTEFGDRQLNALIHESIAHNHDLKAAAGRIQTAAGEARITAAALYPTLSAGIDASRRQNASIAGVGSTRTDTFGVSLNTSWELDIWGRVRKSSSASYANLQAAEADYAARALSLAGQTAKAWFALTEARQQLALAVSTRESFRKTGKQATDRADAGIQSPTDKHLAVSNYASAEALVEQRKENVQRASRQLEVLVGRYPSGNTKGAATLPSAPSAVRAGLPADLIRRRPDLIAAERRAAAADKNVGAARAALYPRISLTGSGGSSSSEVRNLLKGDFGVWSIAGNVVQPIFQGGQLRAQIISAKGRQREAEESFAQAALTAFGEVETALSVEQILANREAKFRKAADAARQASRVSSNRYDQGVDPLLNVLESQRRALDAQSSVISARRARLNNRVDLHLALGGGF
ncbi:multidrug transporter [Oceaniferula spumae]|uniref:Multidrug transporter n=1 Tax=Oceaniferula spumae TaxID=2979115 RepID=A0AAT9FI58_9BACT